jgi:uncharacterized protein YndB with AHSA1/START domain
MLHYQSQVVIERPRETVFSYLIEPARQALWSDVPMRQLTDGPLTSGSRLEVVFGMGPIKARVGLELTSVEEGRRMAFASFSGPIGWAGEYRLTDTESGGTEISQEGTLEFHGLWRLFQPLVGAEISRGEVKELERLKTVVESDSGEPSPSADTNAKGG